MTHDGQQSPGEKEPWAQALITLSFHDEYGSLAPRIRSLYQKAKDAQWDADDINWDVEVQFGSPLPEAPGRQRFLQVSDGPRDWDRFRWELQSWMVSQFLHGEQGALIGTGRLVEVLPNLDGRLFAASQVVDEARHVEVYSRYLEEKLQQSYPIDRHLNALLRDVMSDPRWDIVCLGMQVIVEGIALAAFRLGAAMFSDPLIREITHRVARDESRHVAFGDLALAGHFEQLSRSEQREREDFIAEAMHLLGRRFLLEDLWERMGVERSVGIEFVTTDPDMRTFREALFRRVISTLGRLGFAGPGVRDRLEQLALDPIAQ